MDLKERHYRAQASDPEAPSLRIARSNCGTAGSMIPNHLYQPQKSSTTDTILPPSIALSLRVREEASRSLKLIFDQHMMGNAAASKPEQDCSSNPRRRQMEGFQESRYHSSADLRKPDFPDLELIPKKAQDSPFASTATGFGSPISSPTLSKQETEVMNSQQKHQIPHVAPALFARVSTPKPTAQMTIFYSGTVNVYDNVSSDKAQAIMVLARNSLSSNTRCLAPSTMAAMVAGPPSECTENVVIMKESAPSLVKGAPTRPEASPPTDMVNANEVCIAKNKPFPTSAIHRQQTVLPIASPPPSPGPASLDEVAKAVQNAGVPVRKSSGIELPLSRKASLARFLEKRKDRVVQVQLVGGDQHGPAGEKNEVGGGEKGGCSDKSHEVRTALSSPKLPRSPSSTRQSIDNTSSRENVAASKRTRADDEDDDDCSLRKRSLNEHCFFQ